MPSALFDPPVLIQELQATPIDLQFTPFFYNDGGKPCYVERLPAGVQPLPIQPNDPLRQAGNIYIVDGIRNSNISQYGVTRELDIDAEVVRYAPMWLTPDNAAAFGMTAVAPGQALRIESPPDQQTLQHMHYAYGVFAGHWSPYQGTQNRLLPITCTDLELHNFPHVFASTDATKPLVISVGRYWPAQQMLRLADLWIPQGWCLYIPAQLGTEHAECLNLHNNRNAARACWGDLQQDRIYTQTLLSDTGFFHWYWNAKPTEHTSPLTMHTEVRHDASHVAAEQRV